MTYNQDLNSRETDAVLLLPEKNQKQISSVQSYTKVLPPFNQGHTYNDRVGKLYSNLLEHLNVLYCYLRAYHRVNNHCPNTLRQMSYLRVCSQKSFSRGLLRTLVFSCVPFLELTLPAENCREPLAAPARPQTDQWARCVSAPLRVYAARSGYAS